MLFEKKNPTNKELLGLDEKQHISSHENLIPSVKHVGVMCWFGPDFLAYILNYLSSKDMIYYTAE